MKKMNNTYLLVGLGLWLFILSAAFLFQTMQKEIKGVIDTQALVAIEAQKVVTLYPKGEIPPEKLQQMVEQLKRDVQDFANSKNIVLFAKGAVWGGDLPDYTALLLEYLKEE